MRRFNIYNNNSFQTNVLHDNNYYSTTDDNMVPSIIKKSKKKKQKGQAVHNGVHFEDIDHHNQSYDSSPKHHDHAPSFNNS